MHTYLEKRFLVPLNKAINKHSMIILHNCRAKVSRRIIYGLIVSVNIRKGIKIVEVC